MKTILIYISSWIGLVILAILNAAVRQKGYRALRAEVRSQKSEVRILTFELRNKQTGIGLKPPAYSRKK